MFFNLIIRVWNVSHSKLFWKQKQSLLVLSHLSCIDCQAGTVCSLLVRMFLLSQLGQKKNGDISVRTSEKLVGGCEGGPKKVKKGEPNSIESKLNSKINFSHDERSSVFIRSSYWKQNNANWVAALNRMYVKCEICKESRYTLWWNTRGKNKCKLVYS